MPKKNTLDCWIDRERMRSLLEAVRPGSTRRPSPGLDLEDTPSLWEKDSSLLEPADTLMPDDMTGSRDRFAAKSPFTPLDEPMRQRPSRPPSVSAPPPPEPEPISEQPPDEPTQLDLDFTAPEGSVEERLEALVEWVKDTSRAREVFVVDAYGAALAATPDCDEVFLASVSNLADALGRTHGRFGGSEHGALLWELAEGRMLSLMEAKWDASTIALGVIRETPLPKHLAARYRAELAKSTKPRRRERD